MSRKLAEGVRIEAEIVGGARQRNAFARVCVGHGVDVLQQNEAVALLALKVVVLNLPPRGAMSILAPSRTPTRRLPPYSTTRRKSLHDKSSARNANSLESGTS